MVRRLLLRALQENELFQTQGPARLNHLCSGDASNVGRLPNTFTVDVVQPAHLSAYG